MCLITRDKHLSHLFVKYVDEEEKKKMKMYNLYMEGDTLLFLNLWKIGKTMHCLHSPSYYL